LIVGPSGCGKSTILRHVFGEPSALEWTGASVLDDFVGGLSVQSISEVCQAVGFNTIPAWLRPYAVLSNGERFRVELARRLIETAETIVVDEFTSVVDRQVAQIGAHAVQKYVRRSGRQFVAASCHYDILDWLQPDWTLEPSTMSFQWRSLRRRPALECEIARVPYDTWRLFAPFHYLTADLHKAAQCYALAVNGRLAAFAAMLYRAHASVNDIWGCSRLVTLPDFQGLGLAFVLIDRVAAMYAACGLRAHTYPAHPALVRAFDKSSAWRLEKKPGQYSPARGKSSTLVGFGGRPCAVFSYAGPAFKDASVARAMTEARFSARPLSASRVREQSTLAQRL
jgi:GNAT superfamily N-acetyltransferase